MCVISFRSTIIGSDVVLPVSLSRRSCDIVQRMDDVTPATVIPRVHFIWELLLTHTAKGMRKKKKQKSMHNVDEGRHAKTSRMSAFFNYPCILHCFHCASMNQVAH